MQIIGKAAVLFVFAMTLATIQLCGTEASAQSTYFTSRGCVNCHAAPTVATCAGCHQHSGTIAATTNKTTSYAPGETVTVTLTSSGARSGWIGARLYDQSGAEIARSTGNQSGMGGSAIYPAALSAPAPATAGTYTWKMAYFGNLNGTGTRDVHGEKSVNVTITVASAADTTIPVVSAFALPATTTTLTVPVTTFTATDNVGVTGYLINKSATAPAASATGWTATAPTSVTAVAGSNTFYAWVKDAAGNVSLAKSASVTVTLPDTTIPVVSAFALPATSTSLTVPVNTFTATDNVGVTGYLVNKSATAPAASATGWTATAPTSVTAVAGSNTFYAWVKDAAGNVSLANSASVAITLPNTNAQIEILWRNTSTGGNAIWYMDGATKTGSAYISPPLEDQNWQIVGRGDFNADSKPDIVWRNTSTGNNAVWYMDGTTMMGSAYFPPQSDQNWQIVGISDFNNDGKPDLIWRNSVSGENAVWYIDGTTMTGSAYLPSNYDNNWQIVGTGDFNGDGKPDILWRNNTSGNNAVWYLNGISMMGSAFLTPLYGPNWKIVGAGDFNSDSKPDILWRNNTTGDNAVWYLNGTTMTGSTFLTPIYDPNWQIVGH